MDPEQFMGYVIFGVVAVITIIAITIILGMDD